MNLGSLQKLIWTVVLFFPLLTFAQDCYPTETATVTKTSSQGTIFTDLNGEYPSFCTDFGTPAPPVGALYDPVSAGTIQYDNTALTTAEIEAYVSRVLSVLVHPEYGMDPLPTVQTNSFYTAIQYAVWRFTDAPATLYNASWTGIDGNTYNTNNLYDWAINGTLEPAQAIWLNPQDPGYQSEVSINYFYIHDAGNDGSLQICEGETVNDKQLFSALQGTPEIGGTWSPTPAGAGSYTYTVSGCGTSSSANVVVTESTGDAGEDGSLSICSNQTLTESDLFNALEGNPDVGGSWSPTPNGAGVYTYTVTPAGNCPSSSATVTVTDFSPTLIITQPSCPSSKGSIEVTFPTGADIGYSLNKGDYERSPLFTGLEDGKYQLTIRNFTTGCEVTTNSILIVNEVCAENESYRTEQNTSLCDDILKNDKNAQAYTLSIDEAFCLDESGNQVSMLLDGTRNTVYDKFGTLAGTITMTVNGAFCYEPATDYSGIVPVDYRVVDNGVNRVTDNATLLIEIASASLPVEYLEFNAEKENDHTNLSWTTVSEINNERFEVERSEDGMEWIKIGNVSGSGTSSNTELYSFTDRDPFNGINYYRLKQIDFDGQYEYSIVRSIDFSRNESKNSFEIYPNPSNGIFQINGDLSNDIHTIEVFTMNGEKIKIVHKDFRNVDLSSLNSGMYLLQFKGEDQSFLGMQRLIKI